MSDTKALTVVQRPFDEVASIAERLAGSSLLPKSMQGKIPDVLVTILAGQEMGLPPMASLRAIHVIEGKPVLSADGMVAIALGSGKALYFDRVEESDTSVTYETCRVGAKVPRRCTWTIAMAKQAALHLKDNWRAYPRAMLASRAKSELARDVYPDVLAGCYSHDEHNDEAAAHRDVPSAVQMPRSAASDTVDAEIVSETIDPPEWAIIDNAETEEQLQAIAKGVAHHKGELRKRTKERFDKRREWLRTIATTKAAAPASDVPPAPATEATA